jgi:hypothetical protein
MKGVLNLYLDPKLNHTWTQASLTVAQIEGHGVKRARKLREWILALVHSEVLPVHHYSQPRWNVLDDEDIAQTLQSLLLSHTKGRYITASDVVEIISGPVMQEKFLHSGISRPSISERTARRWLQRLNWRYGAMRNGMYLDGHERDDVVVYRVGFVGRWKEYEKRFHTWDSNGVEHRPQNAFPVKGGRFRLILVTHDESVFYQNDSRKTHWIAGSSKPTPLPKGDGQSIMVSDFLTAEWGRLCDYDPEQDIFESVFNSLKMAYFYIDYSPVAEKPESSSSQASIVMAISLLKTCFNKLTMPLTFLRARPKGWHRGFFSLIMPLHTRKELLMPYQQERCLKVFLVLI